MRGAANARSRVVEVSSLFVNKRPTVPTVNLTMPVSMFISTSKHEELETDSIAAAHVYLSWLCDKTTTASPTAVTISTVTTPASQAGSFNTSCSSGNSTLGAGNSTCSIASANMTTTATKTSAMATPTVGLASAETGWSKADKVFEHHSAAMALVIVVFARSMML